MITLTLINEEEIRETQLERCPVCPIHDMIPKCMFLHVSNVCRCKQGLCEIGEARLKQTGDKQGE